jgi:dTDP-4-amino-4,6-dideoxygalactose transaminase
MEVPILDLKAQYETIKPEIMAALERVLETQHFILGPEVEALEREVAAYSQCAYGIGVSSGTDALLVALMAIGIGPGDEVIVTAYSFFATAGTVARLGAKPVFADIQPGTFNLDPAGLERLVTGRTKAIMPVHLAGQVADMDPILEIARRHNLYVIEDAAQAIGAEYKGRRAGSMGHLGCFSFFPSKNLGGYGDSGMVVANDPALADRVALLRNHGHRPKYYNKLVGGNFRMDALQGAVLRAKFAHLDEWTAARQRNAAHYRRLFEQAGLALDTSTALSAGPGPNYDPSGRAGVILPPETGFGRHIYHLFMIRASRRDDLIAYLKSRGIGSEVYYPVPLHLQECFANLGYRPGDLPVSERTARESLALPIYPELSEAQQAAVVEAVGEFFGSKGKG